MITENLSTLKIHKLTTKQYERELAAGTLDASALYLTPDDGSVVIEEFVPEVEAIIGTVLETKMTPDEVLAASQNGLFLKVMSTDGQWNMYSTTSIANDGRRLIFNRSYDGRLYTIDIDVASDGTMIVGDTYVIEPPVITDWCWDGDLSVYPGNAGSDIDLGFDPSTCDWYECTITLGSVLPTPTTIIARYVPDYGIVGSCEFLSGTSKYEVTVQISDTASAFVAYTSSLLSSSTVTWYSWSGSSGSLTLSRIVGFKLNTPY